MTVLYTYLPQDRLRLETGEQLTQTSSLIGAAGLVLQEENPLFAAQLLGAVESALKTRNAAVAEEVIHFHAQTLAQVKQALREAAFQSAWEEGSKWSLEEAVKKVLDDDKQFALFVCHNKILIRAVVSSLHDHRHRRSES